MNTGPHHDWHCMEGLVPSLGQMSNLSPEPGPHKMSPRMREILRQMGWTTRCEFRLEMRGIILEEYFGKRGGGGGQRRRNSGCRKRCCSGVVGLWGGKYGGGESRREGFNLGGIGAVGRRDGFIRFEEEGREGLGVWAIN